MEEVNIVKFVTNVPVQSPQPSNIPVSESWYQTYTEKEGEKKSLKHMVPAYIIDEMLRILH